MKLIVDIEDRDLKVLKRKVMTIEDMENTLEGRVASSIVHAALYTPYEENFTVRKGVWLKIFDKKDNWIGTKCSECNTATTREWDYCPYCGARMTCTEVSSW